MGRREHLPPLIESMKKSKRKEICHPLEFAKQLCHDGNVPWMQDLEECERAVVGSYQKFRKMEAVENENQAQNIARMAYTVNSWLKHRQCYSITRELADDLFGMDDLSFPLEAMHLPFPVFYLDMEPFHERFADPGTELLGYYVLIDDISYKSSVASCCSIVVLSKGNDGEYVYGGSTFDYYPEHMNGCLKDTIDWLTRNLPDQKVHLKRALLFAAYLSAEEPEVTENEAHKQIYHPSTKPRYSSVRKWDVGVRYAREVTIRNQEAASKREQVCNREGKKIRSSPRPHIRKAHWQTYRIGQGRKGKKVLWIPPLTIGIAKSSNNMGIVMPVVIRERKKEEK